MQSTSATAQTAPLAPIGPLPAPLQSAGCPFLLRIVPSDEGERQAEAMENWFAACSTDEPFALELVGTATAQSFVLRASSDTGLVHLSKQLEAAYPQAELEPILASSDPLLLRPGEHAALGLFALAHDSWMPLKTFEGEAMTRPGNDPLAGLLAAMEALGPHERIVAQLALVRAPEDWMGAALRRAVEHPLQGERDTRATRDRARGESTIDPRGIAVALALVAFFFYRWYQSSPFWCLFTLSVVALAATAFFLIRLLRPRTPIYDMKLVNQKLAKPAFYTVLRVIVIGDALASSVTRLRIPLESMQVAYRQFSLSSANSLVLTHTRHLTPTDPEAGRLPHAALAFPYTRNFLQYWLHHGPGRDVWNSLELSGAFHLPQGETDLPLVRRLSVKHLLFAPEIAHALSRERTPMRPVCIGVSRHRGKHIPVCLPYAIQFANKAALGRTRSGKTALMQHFVSSAMQRVTDGSPQPGIFCIDPHFDFIADLLQLIPPERLADLLLLDLTDTRFPVALNLLDATMGFTRDQAVGSAMSCSERVWADSWGPRLSYFLKNVLLLLYTLNEQLVRQGHPEQQYTLLDINPLLLHRDYALATLAQLDLSETWHHELIAWWQHTYFTLPEHSGFRQEVILPILTKMGTFHDNLLVRRIVGQPITSAPVHEAVTSGKIVLCALSSRDMDDAAVNILGSTLLNLLHRTFAAQHDVPLRERRRVLVAVDEFQAFPGADYDKLLSEDGKYGCAMLLSSQNLKRLNKIRDGLQEMLLSNCEHLFVFNVSAADAKVLSEELREQVTVSHLLSQPRLHCYARLHVSGYPLQVASVTLDPPPTFGADPARLAQAERLREAARAGRLTADDIDRGLAQHRARYFDSEQVAADLQAAVKKARKGRDNQAGPTSPQSAVGGQAGPSITATSAQAMQNGTVPQSESSPHPPVSPGGAATASTSLMQEASTQAPTNTDGAIADPKKPTRRRRHRKQPTGDPPPGTYEHRPPGASAHGYERRSERERERT